MFRWFGVIIANILILEGKVCGFFKFWFLSCKNSEI